MTVTMRIAAASLLVGLAVLGLKSLAWWMTGSVALFSDALESLVNIATALAALIAVRLAERPADAEHPYGHHKAEYFSAVLAGVLIILAALAILHEAWAALLAPQPLDAPWPGLAVNLLAGLLNGIWCWVLLRAGRRLGSPALLADGRHLRADVVSSLGVTAGLVLAVLTGLPVLDPLLAGAVALNVLWSGWQVVRGSLGGLMDEAVDEATAARIGKVIAVSAAGAVEAHDLRTRHAGRMVFIDFHLVVPGGMSVAEAHEICDRIEEAIEAEIGEALVTIHVEPEHKAKHPGNMVLRAPSGS